MNIHIPPPEKNSNAAMPMVVALLAIFVLVGFFILKFYNPDDNREEKNDQPAADEEQSLTVPLAKPEDVAKAIMDKNFQLIDIREKEYYDKLHIDHSINLPFSTISEKNEAFSRDKTIIIIDESDSEQGKILTDHLNKEGLKAKFMEGGLEMYYMRSLPVISFGDPESIQDQFKATPLTAEELNQRFLAGENFKFIDVRTASEFGRGHIDGAINIPLEEIERRRKELPLGIAITCDDDPTRSFQAAVKMHDMDYWGIYYLSDSLDTLKTVVEQPAAPAATSQPEATQSQPAANPSSSGASPALAPSTSTQPTGSATTTNPSSTLPAQTPPPAN